MKSLILLTILGVAVHATVTNSDVDSMIDKLDQSIKLLEIMKNNLTNSINQFIKETEAHTEEENGKDGGECLTKLLVPFKEKVNLRIDESIGGYILSSRNLINDLKNGRLEEGELEHTQHMLSEDGSYFRQMENSLTFLTNHLESDQKEFDKSVHEICCKHD